MIEVRKHPGALSTEGGRTNVRISTDRRISLCKVATV